jgi:hypothetical protein
MSTECLLQDKKQNAVLAAAHILSPSAPHGAQLEARQGPVCSDCRQKFCAVGKLHAPVAVAAAAASQPQADLGPKLSLISAGRRYK